MSTRPSSSNNTRRAFGRDLTDVSNPDATGKGGASKPSRGGSTSDAQQHSTSSSIPVLPLASRGADSTAEARPSSARSTTTTTYNRREADDIDARDSNNPLMVTDYVKDIYDNMRHKESDAVSATYMQRQPHINEKMRAILIDWLVSKLPIGIPVLLSFQLGNIRLMRATLILLYLFLCRSRCIKSFGVFPRRCTSRST